jgi:polyhydroxybutyrate depolymerase
VTALAVVATVVLAGLSGCWAARGAGGSAGTAPGNGGTIAAGTSTQAITVDGRDRTFDLYVPGAVASRGRVSAPAPLVVMLHGGFGTGSQAESA